MAKATTTPPPNCLLLPLLLCSGVDYSSSGELHNVFSSKMHFIVIVHVALMYQSEI